MSTRTVLCFSGGLDSTVLLYHLRSLGHEVRPLMIHYGQRHWRELEYAGRILGHLDLAYLSESLDLEQLLKIMGGSSQTPKGTVKDVPVPEGHYAEESMKATVVPNRNMVLLSLATAWAVSMKAQHVAYAAHAGDHAIYPDCRPSFVGAMQKAVELCDWHPMQILVPFLAMTKSQIVGMGARLGVPFEKTYSCYKGGEKHCGKCGTCVERKEAFNLAAVTDPTIYEEM